MTYCYNELVYIREMKRVSERCVNLEILKNL